VLDLHYVSKESLSMKHRCALKREKSRPRRCLVNHGAEISSVFEDPKAKSEADTYGGVKEK
jgi:hypothetical protein